MCLQCCAKSQYMAHGNSVFLREIRTIRSSVSGHSSPRDIRGPCSLFSSSSLARVRFLTGTFQASEGLLARNDEAVDDAHIAFRWAAAVGGGPVAAAGAAHRQPAGGVVCQVRRPPAAAAAAVAAPSRIFAPLAWHLHTAFSARSVSLHKSHCVVEISLSLSSLSL